MFSSREPFFLSNWTLADNTPSRCCSHPPDLRIHVPAALHEVAHIRQAVLQPAGDAWALAACEVAALLQLSRVHITEGLKRAACEDGPQAHAKGVDVDLHRPLSNRKGFMNTSSETNNDKYIQRRQSAHTKMAVLEVAVNSSAASFHLAAETAYCGCTASVLANTLCMPLIGRQRTSATPHLPGDALLLADVLPVAELLWRRTAKRAMQVQADIRCGQLPNGIVAVACHDCSLV